MLVIHLVSSEIFPLDYRYSRRTNAWRRKSAFSEFPFQTFPDGIIRFSDEFLVSKAQPAFKTGPDFFL